MKEEMKQYEKELSVKIKSGKIDKEFCEYHLAMVEIFQHERLVHLLIMLFFVAVALVLLFLTCIIVGNTEGEFLPALWPFYVITLIVVVLAIAYVRYYYFLENHLQGIEKKTRKVLGIH